MSLLLIDAPCVGLEFWPENPVNINLSGHGRPDNRLHARVIRQFRPISRPISTYQGTSALISCACREIRAKAPEKWGNIRLSGPGRLDTHGWASREGAVMSRGSEDELSPFGKILAVAGFIGGFAAVAQNQDDFQFVPALIVGVVVGVIGAFVGNVLWRVFIVLLTIVIAIGSFYVRQEAWKAVRSGLSEPSPSTSYVAPDRPVPSRYIAPDRPVTSPYVAPDRSAPAPRKSSSYVTCLVNNTNGKVYFFYRWANGDEWKKITLKQNYQRWFYHPNISSLSVSFDNSSLVGYNEKTMTLQTKRSEITDCDHAKKYYFKWQGSTLALTQYPSTRRPYSAPPKSHALDSGKRWVVIASRSSLELARSAARRYLDRFPHTTIFLSQNGQYAVSVGIIKYPREVALKNSWISSGKIPSDSFLSSGQKFLTEYTP